MERYIIGMAIVRDMKGLFSVTVAIIVSHTSSR